MACLQRLAGTDPVSLWSWSVQRARGRPERRLQSLSSERPDARPTWRIVASYTAKPSENLYKSDLLCSETTVYWPHFFAVTIKANVHSVTHGQL